MDQVSIDIGGSPVTLTKSSKLIGLKPAHGGSAHLAARESAMRKLAVPAAANLGGFDVYALPSQTLLAEETLDALRADPAVALGTHVFHTSDDDVPFVPTGQLYVEYAPGAPVAACQALLDEHHLQVVEARSERELIVQVTPRSENPVKVAVALQQSPLVRIAEPDLATPGQIQAFVLPSDPRVIDQWHLQNNGFHRGTAIGFRVGADARVVAAWQRAETLGSPSVVVAVIDDGFDLSHPDLSGDWKVIAPKDFTRNTANPLPDPTTEDWHGTACAGVALGNADGTGIAGASPRSRLMPIRWGRSLSDREIENWFGYVREQGAWVVSCSWSARAAVFALSTRAHHAISRCAREGRDGLGTVICFAAGNENRDINAPGTSVNGFAIHPDVIAVAASNSRDERSSYSNFGAAISLCAPSSGAGGWGITTADVMGQYTRGGQTFEAGYSPGAYTDEFGGTSSATPLVAGIAALLLSIKPSLKGVEVKQLLERTARRIGDPVSYVNGRSPLFGHGCVDAARAVAELQGATDTEKQWGSNGHRIVNTIAVRALPDESRDLAEFLLKHLDDIERHAMDADHAKNQDPEERSRHFIDFDEYGSYPFTELPENFDEAISKFGKAIVLRRGIVPWQIATTYRHLVDSFTARNPTAVLRDAAWLGHYVGDVHVPFHTTANHDGHLTGQKGLHNYFESRLLEAEVSPGKVIPAAAQRIVGHPHELAFDWGRESFTYVQPLLDADRTNRFSDGNRNMSGFAAVAKPIAIERLAKACTRTASLWYTAWLEAGRPKLGEPPQADHGTAQLPNHLNDVDATSRSTPGGRRKNG
jgi:subtilisin family serine protease